ncbi:5-guanidino-2-oxopentanoate decarboxylase [Lutibaculum baratangense]|uniref:Acetohydroxy acid synthase n=1 Tax=Lutibaculum baratangense AMV1 TaxID=631454 RepID=V4RRH9_9HYPH|nr:5-guanidino-2-oxopentanoate decarboxylase [Lutibaculum baratangense]ESR25750.1 Acetohydroxy acid synthase [Lutibaculum baratangense AMV1]
MTRSVGEYLVACLEAYGVEIVFGIPGVHTVELYRGLADSQIRHVTPRHEQGAGFMADGYARATGKPGVCWVITGPGLTNIATAVSQARQDSIPMLVISSANRKGDLGRRTGALHELADQRQVAQSLFVETHRLLDVAELPAALAQAFAVFEGGRPGPVHIELPLDLLSQSTTSLKVPPPHRRLPAVCPSGASLDEAAALMKAARRPVILAGGGARFAASALRDLAEALDAPVVTTVNGRGLLPPDHPLNVPASPSLPSVRDFLSEADLVVAAGTEFGPTDYDMYGDGRFVLDAKLIRIDIDPQQLFRNVVPDIALPGEAAAILSALAERTEAVSREGAARASAARAAAEADLKPGMRQLVSILDMIRTTLPRARIVGDSTQAIYAGNLSFAPDEPGGWFNSATGYGTLGYALPAAIGAKIGAPDVPVVCLVGDGGLQFALGEIGSALDAGVPVIILVWNNSGYGEIKSYMIEQAIEPAGVDLATPDFVALAEAYGIEAERVEAETALQEALWRAAGRRSPSLIELVEDMIMTGR